MGMWWSPLRGICTKMTKWQKLVRLEAGEPKKAPKKDSSKLDNAMVGSKRKTQSNEFNVEKVLEKRTFRRRVEYRIKWRGSEERTWEPRTHLDFDDLLKKIDKNWSK